MRQGLALPDLHHEQISLGLNRCDVQHGMVLCRAAETPQTRATNGATFNMPAAVYVRGTKSFTTDDVPAGR